MRCVPPENLPTPAEVTTLGTQYLRTYLLGTPLIYGFFAVDAAFRASGDTRTPFLLLLSSVLVTLVLDPLLILGIGPFPRLGIAGAAIGIEETMKFVFSDNLRKGAALNAVQIAELLGRKHLKKAA